METAAPSTCQTCSMKPAYKALSTPPLTVSLGANPLTLAGLSGVGDIVLSEAGAMAGQGRTHACVVGASQLADLSPVGN